MGQSLCSGEIYVMDVSERTQDMQSKYIILPKVRLELFTSSSILFNILNVRYVPVRPNTSDGASVLAFFLHGIVI